jgi:hypothetical protein
VQASEGDIRARQFLRAAVWADFVIRRSKRKPTVLKPNRGQRKRQKYTASALRPGKPYRATAEEWVVLRQQLHDTGERTLREPELSGMHAASSRRGASREKPSRTSSFQLTKF